MDMSVEDRFELEKRNDNHIDFHSASTVSLDWRFNGAGMANSSLGLVLPASRDLVGGSSCTSTSVVDSVGPAMWKQSTSSQDMGYCDFDVQKNVSTSSTTGIGKADPSSLISGVSRPLDMGWNPPNSALKSDVFLSNAIGMLPQSLSQVPADLAFIDRAARFSCFSAENSGDMINCFATPASMFLYSSGAEMTQSQELFGSRGLKSLSSGQDQQNATNVGVPSKDALLSVGEMASEGSPIKNHRRSESIVRSHDEAKQVAGESGNESDEAEYSGGYGQDEQSMLKGDDRGTTARNPGSKKRKRSGQDAESNQADGTQKPDEATKGNIEIQQRGDQKPISTANKITRRQGKQGYQASDPPKEDYIHVRARRGQATNSHSLAERVRREKISERMKFLQDLVPGCSKVTGKAVMLDEIINYVQSLQRQVEFLSMKLATVNPRLDFNIEGLLAKDFLPSHTAAPSLAFDPEMPMAYPPLPSTQPGLVPAAAFPGLESHSDILRRTINSQLTTITGEFKEPTQITNEWDDELHSVVQMNYASGAPQDPQPVNGSMPSGQLKIEL